MAWFHSQTYSLAFLFFFSLALVRLSNVEAGEELGTYHVVDVKSLLPDSVCTSLAKGSSGTNQGDLRIAHRHGPCSPVAGQRHPSAKRILDLDEARVDSLRARYTTTTVSHRTYPKKPNKRPIADSAIPAHTGTALGTGNYVVTVGFGTPARDMTVVFDTGSDVTWIQCQPCASSCYQQQEPIFDPSKSSTYQNISCTSPYCSQLDTSGCSASTCLYAVQYGDNSQTVGFFAQDTLTLSPSDVIPSFRFGCGEKNSGLFGKAAGLLGLGREKVSLVSQTASKYGGVFSYCLPATSSSTGYLNFGSKPTNGVTYTSLLTDSSMPTFYFLDLTAILVGGNPLPVSSTVSSAGTIIDSGTVITRLPPAAYSALRSAFRQAMAKYPTAPAVSILDTCYDFSKYTTVTVPKIGLQFRGGQTVNIDFTGILYVVSSSQACLAFAGNRDSGDLGIIGNTQQRKLNVVYDVSQGVVGFGPGGC